MPLAATTRQWSDLSQADTAQISQTCYTREVYEPSDVRAFSSTCCTPWLGRAGRYASLRHCTLTQPTDRTPLRWWTPCFLLSNPGRRRLRDCAQPLTCHWTRLATVSAFCNYFAVEQGTTRRCLEVGSGSGYVTCSLALLLRKAGHHAHCIAVDVCPPATDATRHTLAQHAVCILMSCPRPICSVAPLVNNVAHSQVTSADVVCADLVGPLGRRLHGCVDLMVCPILSRGASVHRAGRPSSSGRWQPGLQPSVRAHA